MEKSMQMNEVEITKTVNCLIKSLVSPPTCDASSISSPESFYLSKAAIKSKSWIEMRKCFSFSASSYFYKVEQREENLGPCKFLLCLEDMIQRILMACRFQIAVIPRWGEMRGETVQVRGEHDNSSTDDKWFCKEA